MPKDPAFELQPGEILQMEEPAIVTVKFFAFMGRVYLTNQRFVYLVKPNPFFGIMSMFGMKAPENLSAPLGSITSAQRTTYGRNDKMLTITLSDGHQVQYGLGKTVDQWVQALGG